MLVLIITVTQAPSAAKMALLQYLQREDGLPDPKGSLSSEVPAAAIARVNQQVQAASETVREGRKHGAYHCYNPGERAAIGILHLLNVIFHACINICGSIFSWQLQATKISQHKFFSQIFSHTEIFRITVYCVINYNSKAHNCLPSQSCPYIQSCNDCCIVHSNSALADAELVSGGDG